MSSKRRDTASQIAFDLGAPPDERRDANTQMHKAYRPTLQSELIPAEDIQPVIAHILRDVEEQAMMQKATRTLIPFPGKTRPGRGMTSVDIDDFQVQVNGDWMDKPGAIDHSMLRAMVDQTPILNAVIMTRCRQVQRFCQVPEDGRGPGFVVRHKDKNHKPNEQEQDSINLLQDFFINCGWEFDPRKRKQLKRDTFPQFMHKLVRDSLTLDAASIETEMKKDRKLGLDGMYAIDGGTVKLCTENGYEGDDEIYAVQLVNGAVRTLYTYEDLIYEPRNPRSDIMAAGYGLAETELLIKVVTGYLNAMTHNTKYFDSNAIPRGLLHLSGNYTQADLDSFKRMWNAMVKGVNNTWALPVMVSKDQESQASFEKFNVDVDEMMFSKWMTFLTSIICALYGMSPDEINFESFTTGASSLSGSDTEEKIEHSKDKGLRPLLSHFQQLLSDYVVRDFSDKYVFRFTGLDEDSNDRRWESIKLSSTWNELRAANGQDPDKSTLGDAPINPSLIGPWLQMNQPAPEAQPGAEGDEEDFGQVPADEQEQADDQAENQTTAGDPAEQGAEKAQPGGKPDFGKPQAGDFGKAFDPTQTEAIVFEVQA